MKTATVVLKSSSPYSQSKPHDAPHLDKEAADDYDRRTWREHLHCDEAGAVIIPGFVWQNALADTASFLGLKIKGKGNNTYAKHFAGGVLVPGDSPLGVQKDAALSERLFLNSDGKRNGGKRVWRTYPVFPSWTCEAEFFVLDETITESVFHDHLDACGKFVGIGRFRPRNRGRYGRFEIVSLKWR